MIEIDWKNDYCHDFVCYKCQQAKLSLNGFQRGKRQFHCPQCQCQIPSSLSLNRRSLYLESRLVDEEIDWSKDYNDEFVCPKCSKLGMIARGINRCTNKRQFYCLSCKKVQQESCQINIRAISDPINSGLTWYTNHKVKGFICPECQSENIYFSQISYGKKRFLCRNCQKRQNDSSTLIYGYCGLDLDQDCHKFRACYTCGNFVATPEKLPQYIKTRDELRGKQSQALALGQDVLVEQFGTQADQLDKIIASLQEAA